MTALTVRETLVFGAWLRALRDERAKARIAQRLDRLGRGLLGDVRSVGERVSELRIDYGPGYRVYFTRRGETGILLLCGGDKARQDRDIRRAKELEAELD
jgi:putative addiction module killer protein